jgi:DNA-directed RNA polymerase specialized sigma24 family protein
MNSTQVGAVLGYVRKLAGAGKDDGLPVHQLLERFALSRDEAASAALLRRHGPMVLGVCRSVLHKLHDAEDAFQATFLVFARKAGSIHRRESVSSWLHRLAYHLAVDAQADAARLRAFEKGQPPCRPRTLCWT